MNRVPLFGRALETAFEEHDAGKPRLVDELGATDRSRLQKLAALATRETLEVADCLEALFGSRSEVEQTTFEAFVSRLNNAAADVGCSIRLEMATGPATAHRTCGFVGKDPIIASAEAFSRESVADVGAVLVASRAVATTGIALQEDKRPVRFFVSYAHDDRTTVDDFLKRFRSQCGSIRDYELDLYSDTQIRVGDRWKAEILSALENCDLGLLLVSPSFLGSEFITEHELPVFVPRESGSGVKPVVPVALKEIDFATHDTKGLEVAQIFQLTTPRERTRAFADCTRANEKDRFALQLLQRIVEKLDDHYGTKSAPPIRAAPGKAARHRDRSLERLIVEEIQPAQGLSEARSARNRLDEHLRNWAPSEVRAFTRTLARPTTFEEMERLDGGMVAEGRDALEELHGWAVDPAAPFFCAVLGEYGIGKTTTLKRFTQELLDQRRSDPTKPLPIYVDLRLRLGQPAHVPTLDELLAEVIERNYKLTDRSPLTPTEIIRQVREEGAVILFDGLDEKIVHLPPAEARSYIRELWKVLPPVVRRERAAATPDDGRRLGKLLISCRSHYFRDVLSQTSLLTGEDREGISRRDDYKVLLMLPFSEEQIRAYLRNVTGSEEGARSAFELIERTHNLRDLAARPVLLNHITEHLQELESAAALGHVVNAAKLYQLVVRRWLARDDGKHQIDPAHKRLLMERLAAKLASAGLRELEADDLETWLDEFLLDHPAVASGYAGRERAVLKEDLRTATFVVRPESGADSSHFRFAHTSLQEFFLACHLVRAMKEGRRSEWDLPEQTVETLDFIGQLLQLEPAATASRCLTAIGQLIGGDELRAAVLGFSYWMRAIRTGAPEPAPEKVNLAHADAEGWEIRGRGPDRLLPLRGANLRGLQLSRGTLRDVDISDADLTGMEARQALFRNVRADRARFDGADLDGLRWRGGSLDRAMLSGGRMACEWIDVPLREVSLPADWDHRGSTCGSPPRPAVPSPETASVSALSVASGHLGSVTACAWSPDGLKLLSASWDNTLKVWDAAQGRCLLTLEGHSDPATACAWSPDGQKLLSASEDNTLRVWDAAQGRCLLSLEAHSNGVTACAWSPDDQKLLSASEDNTLKV